MVSLRLWALEDAPEIVVCCDGDEEIGRWLDQIPQPYTEADALGYVTGLGAWDENGGGLAIADASSGAVLGSLGWRLHDEANGVAEIGYWVRREARGRGVASRAVRLLAHWLLTGAGVERLELQADAENEPSQRVADNAGFTREGVKRSIRYNRHLGRRVDFVLYSLLPRDLM